MNSRTSLNTLSLVVREKQSGIQLTTHSVTNSPSAQQSRQPNKPNRWRACQYRDKQSPNYYCCLPSDCNYLFYCNAHYIWHQNMERFEEETRIRMKLNQEIQDRNKNY